jgi:AAA15 family ATPase/GTPase
MRKIDQIKIRNFKAFQKEQVFNLKGKNVLVYGNNGSGKSSLFWALYTLTQSSIKNTEEIQKYFKIFVESDTSTHQSLRNVFMNNGEDTFIELTMIDGNSRKVVYKISQDIINTNSDGDKRFHQLSPAF